MRYAMITFSKFPDDPRVRREAEALAESGWTLDVICIGAPLQPQFETMGNIHVFRANMSRTRLNKTWYFKAYASFWMFAFFRLVRMHLKSRYKVVHVHNMPDALVFCALIPRLYGARVVLDLHDPMPEVFMAKYKVSGRHPLIRVIKFLERVSIRFADLVVTPNTAFRERFIQRGAPERKMHIIMNSPQESLFNVANTGAKTACDGYQIMYHGYIAERNGLDVAAKALSMLRKKIPNMRFHIYGGGDVIPQLLQVIDLLNLKEVTTYHGGVSIDVIAQAIPRIDLGIIPNRSTPFTRINLPTRIFEYLCMNKPVIAPRTRGILDYFNEDELFFFRPGDADDLVRVIARVYSNPEWVNETVRKGVKVYQRYRWQHQKRELLTLIESMLGNGCRGAGACEVDT